MPDEGETANRILLYLHLYLKLFRLLTLLSKYIPGHDPCDAMTCDVLHHEYETAESASAAESATHCYF
eukprot:1425846-Pleurochrysis_carterae.AAC.3